MKESIIIRNFGPIKDIEINDIRPFTVFIGESGSGKSTILKVVALFRWIFKMVSIRSYLKQSGISNSPFTFDSKEYLRNGGMEQYIKSNTEIIYRRGDCVIEYKKGKLIPNDIQDKTQLSLEKICFITDKRNLIPDILANNTTKESASFYLRETLNDYLIASKIIKELNFDYLGVKFVVKKTSKGEKHFIESTDDNNQFSINLEDASSGTQTMTPLSIVTEYFSREFDLTKSFNNALFSYMVHSDNLSKFDAVSNVGEIKHRRVNIHIEEPELSLYPESQRSLLDYLVTRCFVEKQKDYDMTLMMATHSPYILNHINLLIKAGEKEKLEDGAQLHYKDVDLFEVSNGYLNNLKLSNSNVIDTRSLSNPISDIYNKYNELNKL
jgi:predicted ATPase